MSAEPPPRASQVVEILVDYACAAKCPFCYNPPLTEDVLARRLSLEDAVAVMTRARRGGADGVWLTGGEVTQRADLPQLLLAARKLGFRRIQIGTNGLRTASEEYARSLVWAGLNCARVSIHSASAPVHDALLGVSGAFEKAVESLRVLSSLGVRTGVNFVLCRSNLAELPAFLRRAVGEWGVEVDVLFPHYRGMMERNADAEGVTYAQAEPHVRRALAAVSGLPGLERVQLLNFPPCAAPPEARERVRDWRAEDFEAHELAVADRAAGPLSAMKSLQRRQGAGCAGCRLRESCLGFEDAYAARHGEGEFDGRRLAS